MLTFQCYGLLMVCQWKWIPPDAAGLVSGRFLSGSLKQHGQHCAERSQNMALLYFHFCWEDWEDNSRSSERISLVSLLFIFSSFVIN